MHIGGFHKNSLIDFPGKVACVVFTMGCNFVCPYCHNPDLAAGSVTGTGGFDITDILSFLESRRGMIDGVVISGGEPCIQPDLEDVISGIKSMRVAVKLDTNGSNPGLLAKLLDRSLLDYVAMDIKTSQEKYPRLMKSGSGMEEAIPESTAIIMDMAPDYEFRTTCVRPFINTGIMKEIALQINGAKRYALQKCVRHGPMLDPHFSDHGDKFFSDDEILELMAICKESICEVIVR